MNSPRTSLGSHITSTILQAKMQRANNNNRKNKPMKKAANNRRQQKLDTNNRIPLARTGQRVNVPARISSVGNNITVAHRELIQIAVSNINYTNSASLAINPGLPDIFPWLSRLARCYEQYSFRKLKFTFEPSCPATTAGAIYMAVDFDASDPLPATEGDIASYAGSVSSQTYSRAVLDCPSDRMLGLSPIKYIRHYALPANQDNKTYDVGQFIFGSAGCVGDGARLGTLWVEYVVNLITPGVATDDTEDDSARAENITGGVSNIVPWGSASKSGLIQGIQNPIRDVIGNYFQFNDPGQYKIDTNHVGTVFTGGAPAFTPADCTVTRIAGLVDAAGTHLWESWIVDVLKPLASFTTSFAAVATTLTRSDYRLSPYKYTLG